MSPARRRRYSVVRHLAWSIWLKYDPERCLVTFMAAYDASGSENDRDGTLVVVALVATERKWEKFYSGWHGVLERFDVPYFHMKELNHRHSGEGIYAKWKNDDETPKLFMRALVKAIKGGINKAFSYATDLDDYQDINAIFKLREGSGSPYVLTAGSCHDQINNWIKRRYPKHPIFHVLEKGDCGQRDLERLAKRHKQVLIPLPKINPETGYPWEQFQAADLMAGAYRNAALKRGKVQTFEEYGEVFTDLARMLPQKSLIHHRATLLAMCEANPVKCPKRA
jgi:hypothetical protein